jgi:hypothetical protein
MPLPRETLHDDRLIQYLLGSLPEDEMECLDEQSIVDDQLATRLKLLEDDLVDAYASGTLKGETLRRFESFYLTSPRRRNKAAFTKRFLAAIDTPGEHPAAVPVQTGEVQGTQVRWFRWAQAAAAVLFLATGVLLVQDVRLRRGLEDAERRIASADQRISTLSGQLEAQREADAAAKPVPDTRAAQPAPSIALLLRPQTRGVGPVPIIAIGSGSGTVPLKLAIDGSPAASYEAALRDPATNGVVWRSARLMAQHLRRQPVVALDVPVALLKPQHYAVDLTLFEARTGGASEFAGSYAFEVVRQ